MSKRWYVVHAYSGYEKQVMKALQERISLSGLEDKFGEVLVPAEEVVEMRAGKKRRSERRPEYCILSIQRGFSNLLGGCEEMQRLQVQTQSIIAA